MAASSVNKDARNTCAMIERPRNAAGGYRNKRRHQKNKRFNHTTKQNTKVDETTKLLSIIAATNGNESDNWASWTIAPHSLNQKQKIQKNLKNF